MAELDIARIKRNVAKMIDQEAPERDIDAYVASEGATPDMLRGVVSAAPQTKEDPGELSTKQLDAIGAGASGVASGLSKTAKLVAGKDNAASKALDAAAAQTAPTNYEPAMEKVKRGEYSAVPRAVVEALPGLGVDLTAAMLAKKLPVIGKYAATKLGAFGASQMARTAGERVEQAEGDVPRGLAASAAEAAIGTALPGRVILAPGAMKAVGAAGVAGAAGRAASGVAQGAVAAPAAHAAGDFIATGETPDANQLLADAVVGGATMAVPTAGMRGVRETAGAVRHRGSDPDAASAVANRLVQHAGSTDALENRKTAEAALKRTATDVHGELSDATKGLTLSTAADNAIRAVKGGQKLSETDLTHIDAAGSQPLSSLARQANELAPLKARGGAAEAIVGFAKRHPFFAASPLVGGAAAVGVPAAVASAGPAAAAMAGGYGALRAIDSLTGMRAPAASFARKFSDGTTLIRPAAPTEVPIERPGITGPKITAPPASPWGHEQPAPREVPLGGLRTVLGAEVQQQNRDSRQQAKDVRDLLKQLAVAEKINTRQQAKAGPVLDQGIAQLLAQRPPQPLALPPPQQAIPQPAPAPMASLPPPSALNRPPAGPAETPEALPAALRPNVIPMPPPKQKITKVNGEVAKLPQLAKVDNPPVRVANDALDLPDFLRVENRGKPMEKALAETPVETKLPDWHIAHDKAHMSPKEAANAIADQHEAAGKTYRNGRNSFTGYVQRVLSQKSKAAKELSKVTGLPEEQLRSTLWGTKTNKSARQLVETLVSVKPKQESEIRTLLEPKIDLWWKPSPD